MAKKEFPMGDDIAYQIISGYYPQIASSLNYKKKKAGKSSSTGGKYSLVQGYSDSSIQAAEHRAKSFGEKERAHQDNEQKKKDGTLRRNPISKTTYTDRATGVTGTNYKWVGGTDKFRLYGDVAWYMHGQRLEKSLKSYVAGFKTTPEFSQIYSRSEGNMIQTARAMAKEVFEKAQTELAEEEVQKAIAEWNENQTVRGAKGNKAAMSPEEIGFKAGEYEYIEYKTAMKNPELAKQLDAVSADSKAQPRDMVKIKNGVVEGTMDVTEVGLSDEGQHGVIKVPEGLKKAIKDVEQAGEGGDMAELKKGVEQMFISAIKRDYNPVIKRLKDYAEEQTGEKGASYSDIMKIVKKDLNMAKDAKAGVPDIAEAVGLKLSKHATRKNAKNTFNDQAVRYVAHMLGTAGKLTNEMFQQTHRVADFPSGQSAYAIVPMHQNQEGFFLTPPVKDTEILTGYSATLAMAVKDGALSDTKARGTMLRQKQAWMFQKMHGTVDTHRGQTQTNVINGWRRASVPTTTVSKIAGPALSKLLEGILRAPGHKKGAQFFSPILSKNTYYYNPKDKKSKGRMRKGGSAGKTMFWALPYIGIQQSEYTGN